MADVFTRDGFVINLDAENAIPVHFREAFGATPILLIQVRGGPLPGLPDPWMGKAITWSHDGTLRFTGDVVGMNPYFDQRLGWFLTYTCAGIRNRLDWIPHTDDATGLDISAFNLTLSDPNVNLARSGRTVGQILNTVLTMQGLTGSPEDVGNVASLNAMGIGNITISSGVASLPSVTVTDLSALTLVPPRPIYFGGEKLGDAIDSLLSQWAPNYRWWVDPSGNFRFLDLRSFSTNTLTMGTDPVEPVELARDVSRCFQRVLIRGQPTSVMALLKLSNGDLVEDFAHNGLTTNAAAKAAWTPDLFAKPTFVAGSGQALSHGTVSCTSTTTVTYTSSSATETWSNGYWDQAHQQGTLNLGASSLGTAFTQFWSARIVTCSALTAGGTATFTLDNPLPNTNYNTGTITGLAAGASVVWTQYQIANSALWPRLANQSTYPQAFVNSSSTGATVLSSPMGLIIRSDGSTFPLAYTFNTVTGKIRFIAPTYIIANNAAPTDVWIYQPINTNALYAVWPHDHIGPPQTPQYGGTSYDREGLRKTLTVTIDQWTDPGQFGTVALPDVPPFATNPPSSFSSIPTGMNLYAYDLWTSVADAVVEGEVTYYGFYGTALTFGNALYIAGKDGSQPAWTTGWESGSLPNPMPIREVIVEWPQQVGQDYITKMRISNRRDIYSVDQFLKPPRQVGFSFGIGGTLTRGSYGELSFEGGEAFSPFVQAGKVETDESTGQKQSIPDYAHHAGAPTTEGMQAGINRQMPSSFEPTAGTGVPDFGSQVVAGQDFGAGVHVPKDLSNFERVLNLPERQLASDRAAVSRAFEQFAPIHGQSGQSEVGRPTGPDTSTPESNP